MALQAATIWEFRTTGNNNNGGGFYNRTPGTSVDYSQQNAAQLALTDLAMVTGGTTLTSATGGFTEVMEGNIIYIRSGTHFTVGYYEIVNYTDGNTVTLDRDATDGTNGSSGSGNVGGARALPTDAFVETLLAGMTVYFAAGTYTFTESIDMAADGTETNPISFLGYNAARNDNPTGDNRPLLACAAYNSTLGDYVIVKNFRETTTTASGLRVGVSSFVSNCKSVNSSGTANRHAIYGASGAAYFTDNYGESTNGYAFSLGQYSQSHFNYAVDSAIGFYIGSGATVSTINQCIINDCVTGLSFGNTDQLCVINCTIDGSTTGILGDTSNRSIYVNNSISNCTTGASWTTQQYTYHTDYNNWYNNGTDVTNFAKGTHDIDADPAYTNAGADDFSLDTGTSANYQTGFGIRLGVGA